MPLFFGNTGSRRVTDTSEPSAQILIIDGERNRFQANIALKKKKKPLLTPGQPSAVCSSRAKLWEEEGTAGGGEGRA